MKAKDISRPMFCKILRLENQLKVCVNALWQLSHTEEAQGALEFLGYYAPDEKKQERGAAADFRRKEIQEARIIKEQSE